MARILLLLTLGAILSIPLMAQKPESPPAAFNYKTTYPVDSCLYFMDPMDLRVTRQRSLGNEIQQYQVLFRSSSNNNLTYFISGSGRFLLDSVFVLGTPPIRNGDQLRILVSLPSTVDNPDGSWSGGNIPFPVFLNGFIQRIGNQPVEPPIPIGLHVIRHELIPLSD